MDEMKTTVRTLTFSTNYVPRPPLSRKVGGHNPSAPMGAPPLRKTQLLAGSDPGLLLGRNDMIYFNTLSN